MTTSIFSRQTAPLEFVVEVEAGSYSERLNLVAGPKKEDPEEKKRTEKLDHNVAISGWRVGFLFSFFES